MKNNLDLNRIPSNYFRVIEFTIQTGCPVMCDFCPQDLFIKRYGHHEKFTIDNFKLALLNLQNSTIKTIQFSGFSEPLYHKNISDFIRLSIDSGFEVEIHTTLKGFNSEQIEKVKNLPIKWYISVQPINMHNRKGLRDEEAWNNIKSFLGIEFNNKAIFRCVNLNLSKEQKIKLNKKVKKMGIKNIIYPNFETRAGNITRNSINKFGKKLLCKNNMTPVILPNGDIALCCMDFGLNHIIGNIFNDSFKNILLSDSLQKILKVMCRKEKGEILCHHCEFSIQTPVFVPNVYYAELRKIIYSMISIVLPSGSRRKEKIKAILEKLVH